LFLLLNIEIADFYSTGREIMFRFGVTLAQDLTYTIGWLIFGLGMLMAGIYLKSRAGRRRGGRADRDHDVQGVSSTTWDRWAACTASARWLVWRFRSRSSRWRCRSSSAGAEGSLTW
jgi:hypothetical protein